MAKQNDFTTVEELAEMLKVSPRTVQRIVERKEITALRVGTKWRFRSEWIDEWLRENTSAREADSA